MQWKTSRRILEVGERGMIMGVLNVTPDSFSDGGSFEDEDLAIEHALVMVEQGAEIIDVGGESTRPGAPSVSLDDEMERVLPVIRGLSERGIEAAISIDTMKAEVAEAALAAGAEIINDVSALTFDQRMTEVAAASGAGVVLMHMRGSPRTMQVAPEYDDVVDEVLKFLRQRMQECIRLGIAAECLALDPGIGFGKTVEHNLTLINHLDRLTAFERPVVLGVSRKSFIGKVLDSDQMADREWPTVALTSFGRRLGAKIFRVHSPLPNLHALRMTEALLYGSDH